MVRRLGAAVAVLLISAGLGGISPVANADDVLVVPADFHGDSAVTANVSPETAPYLEVTLVRGFSLPTRMPVVANTGAPVTIPVETWGFAGSTIISLLGCSTADPTTCTSTLATTSSSITQVDAAGAEIEAPSSAFYYPAEQIQVTAHNSGGGVMVATVFGERESDLRQTTLEQVVPTATATALDLSDVLSTGKPGNVQVQRCSSYPPRLCEPSVAGATATFLSRVAVHSVRQGDPWTTPIYTDPSLTHTAVRMLDYGPADTQFPFSASWSIEDASGATVVGPVDAGSGTRLVELEMDLAHQGGANLAGDYVLRFTNTVQTPDGPRSGDQTRSITLVPEPPPVTKPTPTVVDDVIRLPPTGFSSLEDTDTEFSLPAIDGGATIGDMVVRDAHGTVVDRRSYPLVGPTVDTYTWHWDGFGFNKRHRLPRGRYTATAAIHDRYGRAVSVPLGTIRDYGWAERRRTIQRQAVTRIVAPARGSRSRIFRLELPDMHGQRLCDLQPRVSTTGPSGPADVAYRLPAINRRWIGSSPGCTGRRGLQHVPTSGTRVEVRVTAYAGSVVHTRKVGVEATYWHWAL